jgi:hypothetical protein
MKCGFSKRAILFRSQYRAQTKMVGRSNEPFRVSVRSNPKRSQTTVLEGHVNVLIDSVLPAHSSFGMVKLHAQSPQIYAPQTKILEGLTKDEIQIFD